MHHYAFELDGTRHLVAIGCDTCGRRAKPGSQELLEKWQKRGVYYGPGDSRNIEGDYCPEHS